MCFNWTWIWARISFCLDSICWKYVLPEKSLHLILIARTKNPPPFTLPLWNSHIAHCFPCLFYCFQSFCLSLRRNSCAMLPWPGINFTSPTVIQPDPLWQITLSIWLDLLMHRSQAAVRAPKTHIHFSSSHAGLPTLGIVVIVLALTVTNNVSILTALNLLQ